ncbi:vanadium-dependent haloperoxidase [Adhaeribacter radiodurans]|uniref:Vanadium-dependent haloperoxidase n=1 Tax=Adhaeribacter radiodurans TaxID=2745197 RepID=A0A7L7L3X4_9BACT|nr:vanadium-dependent haloperoxidase [Adhaeribacter radiodurans]QMU27521.1 vanadium-dependent haloperoxidase [Adhaeribacter radiodurans]
MKTLSMHTRRKAAYLLGLFLFSLLYGCEDIIDEIEDIIKRPPKYRQESADVVYDWYKLIARIQFRSNPQPVVIFNNRNFGYIGVGLYEAVRPGIENAVSLSAHLYLMPDMPEPEKYRQYLWSASANAALASMYKQFIVGLSATDIARIDSMENAYNNRFKLSYSDAVISRSQAYGRSIATAIYNWSTTDKFNLSSEGYTIPKFPGAWEPTPPTFANPVGPYLKDSRPFLAYSLTATAPPLPFPYSKEQSSKFYKAAREVYNIGKNLTAEQKAIANWWADVGGAGVGVPSPYHLLSIVTGALESKKAKLGQAAEVYAKVGIAQKDGPICTFRGKFQYNLIRPVTFIQRHIKPSWQSYLPTPPYPEYPSGLVGLYGPVMQVLIRELGDIPITDNAYFWRGDAPRHYASITEMNEEAAISRVYAGIHYRFTQNITIEMSKEIGNKIADIQLIKE